MPSPFIKNDKSGKPETPVSPGKPEKTDKPFSIPSVPLDFLPPAANHPNKLVSVTGTDGTVLCLSFSDGIEWRTLKFGTTVPAPAREEPGSPAPPAVPAV